MDFKIIDGFTLAGNRKGYAMEALAFGKANVGVPFEFEAPSPNAAGRLRTLGLTVKSQQNYRDAQDEAGQPVREFVSATIQAVYNADSKEAKAAAELAANPKPRKPAAKKPKGAAKAPKA